MEFEPQFKYETEKSVTEESVAALLAHFEKNQLGFRAEHFRALIREIKTTDLSTDEWAVKTGRTPLAKVEGRSVTFDTRFEQFDEAQRTHVIAHELSHGIAWFLRQGSNAQRIEALAEQLGNLPPTEVSYYVNFLTKNYPDEEGREQFIKNEMLAEVYAQYLESDRTFSGFVQAKLLEFPPGEEGRPEQEIEAFRLLAEEVGSIQEYLDIADNDEEREAFLQYHPKLAAHYECWKNIDQTFREADFSALEAQDTSQFAEAEAPQQTLDWDGYDALEYWEEVALAETFHAEAVKNAQPKTIFGKKTEEKQPSFIGDLINFWNNFA